MLMIMTAVAIESHYCVTDDLILSEFAGIQQARSCSNTWPHSARFNPPPVSTSEEERFVSICVNLNGICTDTFIVLL